jgi:Tc toxin complex TcA C-terminal TcB-binding domain
VRISTVADENDIRFRTNLGAVQTIVTSGGINDTGMFETSLRDERFLPFEGAGAISTWRLELPTDTNAFKRETLTDFVIQMRYTAREGGGAFRDYRRGQLLLPPLPPQKGRLFSAAHDFADAWYAFLHQADDSTTQTLTLDLTPDQFPEPPLGASIQIKNVLVLLRLADGVQPKIDGIELTLIGPSKSTTGPQKLLSNTEYGGILHTTFGLTELISGEWGLEFSKIPNKLGAANGTARLDRTQIADLGLVFLFE